MLKKVLVILVIFCLPFPQIHAQLKKFSAPNLYSEANVYQDDKGNWYSNSVTIKFAKKTIDLPRGIKNAAFLNILIPQTKEILLRVKKKYGKFALENSY